MAYVELYNKNIIDLVNIGKTSNNFNEAKGDYIKVEIFSEESNISKAVVYSNRLLLTYQNTIDDYYFGDYHFHPENPEMGYCTGKEHTEDSLSGLTPVKINPNSTDGPLNGGVFKKQVEVFRDDNNRIYIKPNDIIKLLNFDRGKYRLRIHFLRDIKSKLGFYLNTMKDNLIENGNFFAGLEATQTGDLDKSSGKNNFEKIPNPGFGPYVLCQNGLPGNQYNFKVTGIKPDSNYVFSCWVAWDENFNGDSGLVGFSNASIQGGVNGLPEVPNTDLRGSHIDGNRIISYRKISGIHWYKLFSFVRTDSNADWGSLEINLGKNNGSQTYLPSTNPLGKRYFTDLRLVEVGNLFSNEIVEYINKLKSEEPNVESIVYSDIIKQTIEQKDNIPNQYVKDEEAIGGVGQEIIDSINLDDMLNQNLADNPPDLPSTSNNGGEQ
tara:strand:- start:263 stop:1573 length:1311 start_codon:yes stop_codon:yes gene_type:complete